VQGRSESRWRVIAHRRGGREAWLVRGGIREHDAFLGHEMRGPAGTGRGGVSMAGGWEGQGARNGNGVRGHRLPSPPCFVQNLLMYFGFPSRAGEHPFCVLIYMNSYIFHIYFIVCLTLSLADTHGISGYARTYIQRYTHTHTHTKKTTKKTQKAKKRKEDVTTVSKLQSLT